MFRGFGSEKLSVKSRKEGDDKKEVGEVKCGKDFTRSDIRGCSSAGAKKQQSKEYTGKASEQYFVWGRVWSEHSQRLGITCIHVVWDKEKQKNSSKHTDRTTQFIRTGA